MSDENRFEKDNENGFPENKVDAPEENVNDAETVNEAENVNEAEIGAEPEEAAIPDGDVSGDTPVPDEDVFPVVSEASEKETAAEQPSAEQTPENANSYEWVVEERKPEPKNKKSSSGLQTLLIVLISVFGICFIGLLGYGVSKIDWDTAGKGHKDAPSSSITANPDDVTTYDKVEKDDVVISNPNYVDFDFKQHGAEEALSIPEIASKCTPSCVGIVTESEVTAG